MTVPCISHAPIIRLAYTTEAPAVCPNMGHRAPQPEMSASTPSFWLRALDEVGPTACKLALVPSLIQLRIFLLHDHDFVSIINREVKSVA